MNSLSKILKWLLLLLSIGSVVGSASAIFLMGLKYCADTDLLDIPELIFLLPVVGLISALAYDRWAKGLEDGKKLILEEIDQSKKSIPFRLAPMVFFSTLLNHFFGASVGREGVAIQLGGVISDRLGKWYKFSNDHRRLVLLLGISAAVASVFGTPLAGAIFAIEILPLKNVKIKYFFFCLLVAYVAFFTSNLWPIEHADYGIASFPQLKFENILWVLIVGFVFGAAAALFITAERFFKKSFEKLVPFAPWRILIGGFVIAFFVYFVIQGNEFNSLGLSMIKQSFILKQPFQVFIIKLLLTAFTLCVGFKGGEVTPLFFVGATLGSALFAFVPLPLDLLAAMGFVAVFAAATNAPIACAVMGIELFGFDGGVFMFLACVSAYLISPRRGLYSLS